MTAARANSQLDRTLFTKIKRGHPFTAAQIRNARCDRLLYRMLVVQWDSVTLHDCFRNIAVTPIIPHISAHIGLAVGDFSFHPTKGIQGVKWWWETKRRD